MGGKKFLKKFGWVITAIILIPFVVLILYSVLFEQPKDTNYVPIVSGLLSYIGTAILSFSTMYLTASSNERGSKNEEIQLRHSSRPSLCLEEILDDEENKLETVTLPKTGWGDVLQCISVNSSTINLVIKNVGNSSAYNVQVYAYSFSLIEEIEEGISGEYKLQTFEEVPPNSTLELEYSIPSNASLRITYNICYENEYGHGFYNPVLISIGERNGEKYAQASIKGQVNKKGNVDEKENYDDFRLLTK